MLRIRRFRSTLPFAALLLVASALAAQEKRPLTLDDYGAWSRIQQTALSPDGKWMTWVQRPNDGDATLFVKELDGNGLHQATNGAGAAFSDDGRWVAFLASPPQEEAERLRKQKKPVPRTLHLLDLRSGESQEEVGVQAFTFSEGGRFLAIHRDRSDADAKHTGSDLLLRDLQAGTVLSFGNVAEYAFNEGGTFLAYLVDAAEKAGNGLYVVTADDGRIRPLNTGPDRYEDLAWSEAHDDVAALRGEKAEGKTQRANTLVVVRGVDAPSPRVMRYDPAADDAFPEGFVLSELATTRWTGDGTRVVVGIKEQDDAVENDPDADKPNVDVWHWADDRLQSQQMVQANADTRYTYTSVYNVDGGRFVRLATEDMQRVDLTDDGRWALGRRDGRYRGDVTEEQGRADWVRIDPATGQERVIAEAIRRPMGTSPDGRWALYVEDEAVKAANLESLAVTDLTGSSGVDFIDREQGRTGERGAFGVAGWTEDGKVLLNSQRDVWAVPLAGGAAQSVSGGMGERESILFRMVRLDRDADWTDPRGALLSGYGEWTKKSGYFRARPGQDPEALLYADAMIDDVVKAESADRVAFTRQTFEEFPDWWVSDSRFHGPRKVTDANPQIAEYLWGRRVLVDYTDQRGNKLQATLALPAGYEAGRRYPMIVYFYEKMSQRHHEFSLPVYDDRPHMSTYASNGYLVLMPDIVYDRGYPGSSALDDVTAAAKQVVELGYADPEHIGLQGHSWGGYETSFILTQTDMFATIVTGAPLTNLMSMNNILYKSSGGGNGPILQWSQGRMGDTPWDDPERWRSQSPIEWVPDISTPFLILQGTADGAVDWNQGLELFTAARRLGKEVVFLSYPDEPHHLAKEANQKDFQVRMRQWFDHYLRGEPAPEWMADGVPFLRKGRTGPDGKKVIS
ncbi:MAG TPA: prolyl oligopeptidase family serine peptidase [Longimicrobiales bacterium]|nr:prolyl oligopeptidase family serine peptidase [Longimicrobiales bacterium]